MVPEVYDSLFFPSYLSFPLEGKSREAGKGVRGRAPIGCSIAVLTANRRPPREKVLKIDRPFRAGGFLSLTALRAEGCGIALSGDKYYNAAFRRSRSYRVS